MDYGSTMKLLTCGSVTPVINLLTVFTAKREGEKLEKLDDVIKILTDDFSFDENGIMKITREAVNEIVELLKEQQAEIEYMKSERTDEIEEIEREISVRERDPVYKTFSRGIVNGLEMALRIINEKGR